MGDVGTTFTTCPHGFRLDRDYCAACQPKGQTIPQTVPALQKVLALDGEQMRKMDAEQSSQRQTINKLRQRIEALEAQLAEYRQDAERYKTALETIRDSTPANASNKWPHHHYYLNVARMALKEIDTARSESDG